MKKILLSASLLLGGFLFAAEEFDATVDRNAPDFIRASILVCGPGGELYGAAGHAAMRLQCPTYKLDVVFSSEGERIRHSILRFFAGRLKMGTFAIPTAEFVSDYRAEGRGITEYPLNLSPQAKIRLWKRMDERVNEGALKPYDFVKYGCAQSLHFNLLNAVSPEQWTASNVPSKFYRNRHESVQDYIPNFPWKRLLIQMLMGPEADKIQSPFDSVVMPGDLIEYLRCVSVNGQPILDNTLPKTILPQTVTFSNCGKVISPLVVSFALFFLSVIGCFWMKRAIFLIFAALYVALAVFETYVGVFSTLPAAAWNVLLIPFNPLPILFWKWRKYWAKPFAAVLVGWAAWVFFAPHLPTDPAFAVLSIAYAIFFAL